MGTINQLILIWSFKALLDSLITPQYLHMVIKFLKILNNNRVHCFGDEGFRNFVKWHIETSHSRQKRLHIMWREEIHEFWKNSHLAEPIAANSSLSHYMYLKNVIDKYRFNWRTFSKFATSNKRRLQAPFWTLSSGEEAFQSQRVTKKTIKQGWNIVIMITCCIFP